MRKIRGAKLGAGKFFHFLTLLSIVLGFSFLSFSAKTSFHHERVLSARDDRKDNVPWPWGKEIEFPWREAPGVYSIFLDEQPIYLRLNVVSSEPSEQPSCKTQLKPGGGPSYVAIQLVDVATCSPIGVARGFKVGHLIRAQFVNQLDNEVYTISLHAFDESIAKMSGVYTNLKDMVMVASVELLKQSALGEAKTPTMTSPLVRVANASEPCSLIQKKLEKGL